MKPLCQKPFSGILVISCFVFLMTSCVSTKKFSAHALLSLQNMAASDSVSLTAKPIDTSGSVPSIQEWKSERDGFISKYQSVIDNYHRQFRKADNGAKGFLIAGTIVGVGGGVYGIVSSNNQQKASAITSLVTGALTAIVAGFRFNQKTTAASQCIDQIYQQINGFSDRWPDGMHPQTWAGYINFYNDRISTSQTILGYNCSGNIGTSK